MNIQRFACFTPISAICAVSLHAQKGQTRANGRSLDRFCHFTSFFTNVEKKPRTTVELNKRIEIAPAGSLSASTSSMIHILNLSTAFEPVAVQ